MNRRIYLIRHGHPDFPLGSRICLGQTDTPLGPLGRLQGVLLAQHLADVPLAAVYTSPLARARETARFLSADAIVVPGLAERATGLWDGRSFEEIARRWPEEYAARGDDPTLTMPGGEDLAAAGARFADAIAAILAETQGDIAIVAHKGVIETFLLRLGDGPWPKLPYGGYWLLAEEGGVLTPAPASPVQPHPPLDPTCCRALLAAVCPPPVIDHCEAVAALALEIAAALPFDLDQALIGAAARLHDIARTQPDHARTGAAWLEALGYADVARIVRQHHDLERTTIDEASVVYIADKCLSGSTRVPLRARFAASREKCAGAEALAAWQRRWQVTEQLQQTINAYCGKELLS